MNDTLNRISDYLEFDIGCLELLELSTDRSYYDISSWPNDRIDRSIRRLLAIGANVKISGVINDDYNPRRVFDIVVFDKPYFHCSFETSYNQRRFPPKIAVHILSSR